MTYLVFWIYKWIVIPIAWSLLQIARPFLRGKMREMIDDKNHQYSEIKNEQIFTTAPLWIHASSGEIEYARPLIREFKKQNPEIPILVTYSSPSAKKILRQMVEIDAWTALPWDLPFSFSFFLRKWKPRMLLVARTDLWPVMAQSVRCRKVPAFMFSATFAENSSRLRGVSQYLTRYALNRLQKIFCVNEKDLVNLQKLKLKTPVEVLGDTRFDQVLYRLQHPKPISITQRAPGFTFIMGSTWPEDEKQLIPAIAQLSAMPAQFILAPHEIHEEHLQDLERELTSHGLRYVRYTQFKSWDGIDIIILNQVGVLAEVYKMGDAAFVGGSFRKQVHSVMEPLAAGLHVLVGPFHLNNREALDFQSVHVDGINLVQCVRNSDEIVNAVKKVCAAHPAQLKPKVIETIRARTGVTKQVIEKVSSLI